LVSTCTTIVTVEDDNAPVANCVASLNVQLDANGNATISASDIDNGSTSVSGIASLSIDITGLDCSTIGENTVTLTVTGNNGLMSTCTTTVTVEDSIDPQFDAGTLPDDQTREADLNGRYSLEDFLVGVEASDNCTINANLILSQDPVMGTVLTEGLYDITLSADDQGNVAQYTFVLQVIKNTLGVNKQVLESSSIVLYPNSAKGYIILSNLLIYSSMKSNRTL
jgi:hypothetical protein